MALTVDSKTTRFEQTPNIYQRAIIEFSRRFAFENGAIRKYGGKRVWWLREGWVDHDYYGLTLRLNPLQGSSRIMLMTPYWYDRRERAFVEQCLPHDGMFFDIGANAGFYTFFAAARRPQARIVAVEPDPELASMLRHNIAANNLVNVDVEVAGLSDVDGEGLIEGTLRPTVTLLHAIRSRGIEHIDLMKIDIEGMEDQVLLPFFRMAPRSLRPRAIIGEHIFAPRWREECLSLGYRQHWQTRYNCGLVLQD